MWSIKKITILLCFLSLVAFISCSAEDKTGSPKPEGETEITGETGGGSGTGGSGGSGESGSGGGGGETGGTETTEIGNFPPPEGTYKDTAVTAGDTVVSKMDENTTKIKGNANGNPTGQPAFDFNISKGRKQPKMEKLL